ncbi:MAG: RNA polymerase sigma factor [Gemmataceae bacterium]|nr:RNA polymerase sigma factor [Gemmataceae bacterium]
MNAARAPDTSPSLLAQVCAPDEAGFERFVRLYGPAIGGWCRRRGLGEADAEDVSQAVFLLLRQKLPGFVRDPARRGFRAWLRTITNNEASDFLKAESRHRLAPLMGDEGGGDGLLSGLAERDLLQTAMERAKAECDPVDWRAFLGVKLLEQPPAQVAATLSITVAEVYRACWRVKTALARHIRQLEE